MPSKKKISIILCVVFFISSLAFLGVCVYALYVNKDQVDVLLANPSFYFLALYFLLSLAAAIALLKTAGKKALPVAIAILGSGALFAAVPNIVNYIAILPMIDFSSEAGTVTLTMFTAQALSALAGIAACVFAAVLNRRLLKGEPEERPVETQPVVQEGTEGQGEE